MMTRNGMASTLALVTCSDIRGYWYTACVNRYWLMVCVWLLASNVTQAGGLYQTPEAFLDEVFAGSPPQPQVVWLRGDTRETIEKILGHRYPGLRIRYWSKDGRTAWILEEIGKERPITTGMVVNEDGIERVRVLEFRERHIDGISGATLSVRALKKLARLSLYLHSKAMTPNDP